MPSRSSSDNKINLSYEYSSTGIKLSSQNAKENLLASNGNISQDHCGAC
jgi:hypothetical protein